MNELLCQFANDGSEDVGWGELVDRLSERDEDEGDLKLVVSEVLDDVRVESEDTELVGAHDSSKERHDEDLVVQRILLVYTVSFPAIIILNGGLTITVEVFV